MELDKNDPRTLIAIDYQIEIKDDSSRLIHITLEPSHMQGIYQEASEMVQNAPDLTLEQILEEKVEILILNCYHQVVKEVNLDVLGMPKIDILQWGMTNPLKFVAEIQVMPEVIIPSLDTLTVQIPTEDVQDEAKCQQLILQQVVDESTVELPQSLLEQELQAMWVDEEGSKMAHLPEKVQEMSLHNWMNDEDLQQTAAQRVKTVLVLATLARTSDIDVTPEEIESYATIWAQENSQDVQAALQQMHKDPTLNQQCADQVLFGKISRYLQNKVQLEAVSSAPEC